MKWLSRWERPCGRASSLALCGLLLLAAGCGGGGGLPEVGTSAAVRGRVVDAVTGVPIPDATVTASGRSVRTGADGEFALSATPGTVNLEVSADNYNRGTFPVLVEADRQTDVGNLRLSSIESGPPAPPL